MPRRILLRDPTELVNLFIFTAMMLASSACGISPSTAPASTSSQTLRLATTPFTVPAGAEREVCEVLVLPSDVDIQVLEFQLNAGAGTHHVLLMAVDEPADVKEGDIFECQQQQMALGYKPLMGTDNPSETVKMPEGVAMPISARQKLLVDHHVLNLTGGDLTIQARFEIQIAADGAQLTPAGVMFVNNVHFKLPPGTETTSTVTCVLDREIKLSYLVPHMHELGVGLRMTYSTDANESPTITDPLSSSTTLIDIDGYDELNSVDLTGNPLVLKPGDRLSLSCTWDNSTDEVIRYPDEMCMVGILVFPTTQALYCDGTGMYDEDDLN